MDDYEACEVLIYDMTRRLDRIERRREETIRRVDSALAESHRLKLRTEQIKVGLGIYGRIH